jgi:dihydrofolate reductase (trimethoprim resistance protein)
VALFADPTDATRAAQVVADNPKGEVMETGFTMGSLVQKKRGSKWRGKVVGFYSTDHTERGYSVESLFEQGSVQVWPEAALEPWDGEGTPEAQAARIAALEGELKAAREALGDTMQTEARGVLETCNALSLPHEDVLHQLGCWLFDYLRALKEPRP